MGNKKEIEKLIKKHQTVIFKDGKLRPKNGSKRLNLFFGLLYIKLFCKKKRLNKANRKFIIRNRTNF